MNIRRAYLEKRLVASTLNRLLPGVVHSLGRPVIGDFVARTASLEEVLDEFAPGWREFQPEYEAVEADLAER
jgi:hypothetical protein